jgi:cephalosporin hydroxylase
LVIPAFSNIISNLRFSMNILSYLIIDNAFIILLFILLYLAIIIIIKVDKMKINRLIRFVALFLLFNVLWILPVCIIYDQRKNCSSYFHQEFYHTQFNTLWLGIPAMKNPLDFWVYQQIIYEIKPDIIIECGTAYGGSALFFANICDLINHGKVITIDIEEIKRRPEHNRIIYLHGSSTSDDILNKVKSLINKCDKVLVILDSDHHKQHVLNELILYSKLVSKGSYIVVEDTNINGHPVLPNYGDGPMEAVNEFLKNNTDFFIDKSREKYLLTFYPNGWLKKIN